VATTAADLLVVAFSALAPEEQEEAFAQIADRRLQRLDLLREKPDVWAAEWVMRGFFELSAEDPRRAFVQ
jgi:CelD/BcsL family acetyltransferase involved in cellulose biosynthesis